MTVLTTRRLRPAVLTAVLTLTLAACGSTAGTPAVTVVQEVTVVPTTEASAPVTVPEIDPEPTTTPPPSPSSSAPDPSPTEVDPTTVGSAPPPSDSPAAPAAPPALVVRVPDDPDTPGAVGGPACSADAKYFDEDPAGLAAPALEAWTGIVATAAAEGVVICLHDGKRSAAQQQAQYDEYVELYGQESADQLVLPWEKSAHVTGYAVDVHPSTASSWLQARNGADGWCRIYDNEPWHFEFAEEYRAGCPVRLPKPIR